MEARLPGRIHGQVNRILSSKDRQWIDTLSVTIAVLHEQFRREQHYKNFGPLRYRKLTRIEKFQKNSA